MTPQEILNVVCNVFNVAEDEIKGQSPKRLFHNARSVYAKLTQEDGIDAKEAMRYIRRNVNSINTLLETYPFVAKFNPSIVEECRKNLYANNDPSKLEERKVPTVDFSLEEVALRKHIFADAKNYLPFCTYTNSEKERMFIACRKALEWGMA